MSKVTLHWIALVLAASQLCPCINISMTLPPSTRELGAGLRVIMIMIHQIRCQLQEKQSHLQHPPRIEVRFRTASPSRFLATPLDMHLRWAPGSLHSNCAFITHCPSTIYPLSRRLSLTSAKQAGSTKNTANRDGWAATNNIDAQTQKALPYDLHDIATIGVNLCWRVTFRHVSPSARNTTCVFFISTA